MYPDQKLGCQEIVSMHNNEHDPAECVLFNFRYRFRQFATATSTFELHEMKMDKIVPTRDSRQCLRIRLAKGVSDACSKELQDPMLPLQFQKGKLICFVLFAHNFTWARNHSSSAAAACGGHTSTLIRLSQP
jgi:hypothetical protein